MSQVENISFRQLKATLLDTDKVLSRSYLYRLADMNKADLDYLSSFWFEIPVTRRRTLMEDIEVISEDDTLIAYENLCLFALTDSDAIVREIAIRLLWEYENPKLPEKFMEMLEKDPEKDVRAAAASALGQYVYLGEIEELPENVLHKIEDLLLRTCRGSDHPLVQRKALEALGFSSLKEASSVIDKAYKSGNNDWLMSSLFAMGRSANSQWIAKVKAMLDHDVAEIRCEAARAAGELEAKSCREKLMELAEDFDIEVRQAAVWSLSQIGGNGVRELLTSLIENADIDEELEFLESALDNLAFTEDVDIFSLVDVDELGEDDLYLEDEDDEGLKDED